jgi:DNA-binding Xre family transcriptional regulator
VTYVLRGQRNILPTTAKKICDALECDFDEVFNIVD